VVYVVGAVDRELKLPQGTVDVEGTVVEGLEHERNVALAEEYGHKEDMERRIGDAFLGCGIGEVVAEGRSSRCTGCTHCTLAQADTVDFDCYYCTVFSSPYPAACPALPADDDSSSSRQMRLCPSPPR